MTENQIMKLVPADLCIPSSKSPFEEPLESLGFEVGSQSPGHRQQDRPLVTRFRRLRAECVVTVYEYNFNFWAAIFRTEPAVEEKLHQQMALMAVEEAFERASAGVDGVDADLDVGLLAFHAPEQPEPEWLDLYLRYLNHDDPYVRVTACRSVRWVGDVEEPGWPELWDVIRQLEVADPDEGMRRNAKKVLSWKQAPPSEVIP